MVVPSWAECGDGGGRPLPGGAELAADLIDESLRMERLGQYSAGAALHAIALVCGGGFRGEEEDGHASEPGFGAQVPQHNHAVHAGHHGIGHDPRHRLNP
jgi:hypothetical protein